MSGNIRENHIHLLVSCPTDMALSKIAQYLKGKSSYRLQKEFKGLQKRYWGQHLWARGYFCVTVGAVNKEMIRRYVENQSNEEGDFKIWDLESKQPKPERASLSRFDYYKLINNLSFGF